jgi:hypothetical protein
MKIEKISSYGKRTSIIDYFVNGFVPDELKRSHSKINDDNISAPKK